MAKNKQELHEFVTHLCEKEQIPLSYIENMSYKQKGGRGYHHDFDLILNNMKYNIEFKFNAQCVQDTPQFVSPMKPSKFLEKISMMMIINLKMVHIIMCIFPFSLNMVWR